MAGGTNAMAGEERVTAGGTHATAGGRYADGHVDDVMVVGVGGQGVLVAAAVIADAALRSGDLEVKLSETRGMSQRGGSVQAQIRIGRHVVASSISPGEVDYLLAFEAAEGLRWAPSVVAGGVAIVSTEQIVPPLAAMSAQGYPYDAVERLRGRGFRVVPVDGNAVAAGLGSTKVAGMVLVGALSAYLPFDDTSWRCAVEATVPGSWLEMNLKAFAAGRELAEGELAEGEDG